MKAFIRHMYVDVYGRLSFTGRSTIKDNSLFEVDNTNIGVYSRSGKQAGTQIGPDQLGSLI